MDEMILLLSDEIYPRLYGQTMQPVGANKDTAFLWGHISQIRTFSLFCTETQDPVARAPRMAALIPTARRGFAPVTAKSPLPKCRSCLLHCQAVPLVPELLQGWSSAQGSSALRQGVMNFTLAEGGSCFGCASSLRKSPAHSSQGSGPSGAAVSALSTALAGMLEACGQFTCFQISLQVLKFSPGLF